MRRYQWQHAGELVHVDIMKLASLRHGIGHCISHDRQNRLRTPGRHRRR
jgi:hypothetical protein